MEKKKSVNKKCGGQRHVYVYGASMRRAVSESVGERVRARQRDGPGRESPESQRAASQGGREARAMDSARGPDGAAAWPAQ